MPSYPYRAREPSFYPPIRPDATRPGGVPLHPDQPRITMWYFAWILGIGFAVLLAILNALWGENAAQRSDNAPTA
jgi:cytochrome bd-I ubiquinol oxidase subunit X